MIVSMRVLLLLSAMLSALCGVVTGTACASAQVEASVSIGEQAAPASAMNPRFADSEGPRALPLWPVVPAVRLVDARPIYADRRRE